MTLTDNSERLAVSLQELLDKNSDKRVIVLGTTCTGKSTLLKHIKGSYDMDELVFPKLTPSEAEYVCQDPWTEEIGRTMTRLVKEKVKVENGKPVFGTVVLDSDLIINLKISDNLLRQRTFLRGASYEDAKRMQTHIEKEIRNSGIRYLDFSLE